MRGVQEGSQCGRVRLGFGSQPSRICLLEWNMVGFSVRDRVGWETLKAHAEREDLHPTPCSKFRAASVPFVLPHQCPQSSVE